MFIGLGQCIACHSGPGFSDGEFHRSRIASKLNDGTLDDGRALGVEKLLASAYTRSGRFNDEKNSASKPSLRTAEAGAFRTPGLREVGATGPYMHDGSIDNLCDAVQPHAALEGQSAPALTPAERLDLVAFLRTLDMEQQAELTVEGKTICR